MQIAGANGTAIAKRLWELDNQGCYVDIVADEIRNQGTRDGEKKALEYLLRRPEALPPNRVNYHGPEVQEFSGGQCGVHQKNLLIDGYYDGKKNQKVVFTGSHNMNNKSPRYNDEVILQINDSEVHDGFKRYFFDLRAGAAITWQTSKFDVEPKRDPEFNCRR
ncbi:MAG: phospholipase D-like domain-containing protein [Pseudonocardiaceae bacterium]